MENRKLLRIGKSVVHGRTGPLRGDIGNVADEEKGKNTIKNRNAGDDEISNNGQGSTNRFSGREEKGTDEDALNRHFNAEESEHNSGDIFEQLLQRELAKGALGGGVVEKKGNNKLKANVSEERNNTDQIYDKRENKNHNNGSSSSATTSTRTNNNTTITTTNTSTNDQISKRTVDGEEDTGDLSKIDLIVRVNSNIVKYRMHGYSEVIKCFTGEENINEKMEIVNTIFKEEENVLKYLGDNNLICQIKAAEMTDEYISVLKEIYFHNFKDEYESEEELINSFVNENKNKLFSIFTKIEKVLIEKILTNTKSFDNGFNIVRKLIEYCSNDKITINILTALCEHMNGIYLKANKSVSNIKGIKIKVISSILLLLYKLLSTFRASIICVKTLNKFCFKFKDMIDKSVKTNFYLLYIEMLSQVKNVDFQNSILNELNNQQKNYITKELQKEETQKGINGENVPVRNYLLNRYRNTNQGNGINGGDNDYLNNNSFLEDATNLIEETDVFKEICTKQWEIRVLEGCIDNNSAKSNNNNNNSNNSLSNENLLPWKIKVEAINLLYDRIKSKHVIKKTPYISTILNIINKLFKNESALPVVVSTLKLLHILIEKFEKDIYTTVKTFTFILCAKLKDSNKQVSNACIECLTKAISVYNIDIFIDDLSKNLKDKNNNTRMVTLDFLLKIFDYIDRKNIVSIIDITKHLLNDTVANIKNMACKIYSLIVTNYGESVHTAFFNSLPSNKKRSIMAHCSGVVGSKGKSLGNTSTENANVSGNMNNKSRSNNQDDDDDAPCDEMSNSNDVNNNGGGSSKMGRNLIACPDNIESVLPRNILSNLKSNSHSTKIEGIQELTKWISSEINLTKINLEHFINLIKKNCYDFKGKYNQLNNAIFDFFNQFVDHMYHFNIHRGNNPHFVKIMNILIPLYIEKTKDKKDTIVCNNFLQKCFHYFDNNIIIDIVIKNNDAKNAKKCEECIKILQKLFLSKIPNGGNTRSSGFATGGNPSVNIKNLIYFLKKFVDSKNTNLKNSSILLLQLLSKNFGDKYVLSHLEGISENIRQSVKSKDDVERFVHRQGFQCSNTFIRAADNIKSMSGSIGANEREKKAGGPPIPSAQRCDEDPRGSSSNGRSNSQVGGQMSGQMGGQMSGQMGGQMSGQMGGQMSGQMSGQMGGQMGGQMSGQHSESLPDQANRGRDGRPFRSYNPDGADGTKLEHLRCGDNNQEYGISVESSSVGYKNTVEIDYTNTYLNYKSTKIVESKNYENRDNFLTHGRGGETEEKKSMIMYSKRQGDHVEEEEEVEGEEKDKHEDDYGEEEEEEEEKMVNISNIIKQYVNQIMNENNHSATNITKIISVIEKVGKYYINPDKLEVLINKNTLHKIYSLNKNKCVELLYVLMFSLRDNTHIYADTILDCILRMIGDVDITGEQIDKLLTCMCKNMGISKYIGHINGFILNEKLSNMRDEGNIHGHIGNHSIGHGKGTSKRNKIQMLINNINTNHILLLNENVIKKKVLKFYLDFFFDDNEQVREKASIVLDHIYAKYKGNIFFEIFEKLSLHKKECLQDILNQMKVAKEEFSFYKIFMSHNSQLKRISNNECNLSATTPAMSKSRSIKKLTFISKNKVLKIDFPPNHKIKVDNFKWEKHFDQLHLNYLMKEFKAFSSQELVQHMFSENVNMVNR